jgi:hypothetical protein
MNVLFLCVIFFILKLCRWNLTKNWYKNGIPLDKVLYISYAIEIGSGDDGWGSLDNFTIFSAAQFFITFNYSFRKILGNNCRVVIQMIFMDFVQEC